MAHIKFSFEVPNLQSAFSSLYQRIGNNLYRNLNLKYNFIHKNGLVEVQDKNGIPVDLEKFVEEEKIYIYLTEDILTHRIDIPIDITSNLSIISMAVNQKLNKKFITLLGTLKGDANDQASLQNELIKKGYLNVKVTLYL